MTTGATARGASGSPTPLELLRRESRSLVERLRLWPPARWAAQAPVLGSRADVVHHLVQRLADQAADLEQRPRRPVPRLDSDLGLPDQLAVTADDLVRAAPSDEIATAVVAHLLLHRRHLLDEQPPATLAAALGLDDVDAAGRRACETAPA